MVGGVSSPLQVALVFILVVACLAIEVSYPTALHFPYMCSANVTSSSELLSPPFAGAATAFGAGLATAGPFALAYRLRFVGLCGASEFIASRSCLFASVSCFASTHFLRWCVAGAALLQGAKFSAWAADFVH